ncbi:MAG TPA: phage tail protein [Rhizomicrobium sp.]|nr:phage tail protein [Rhizomicrobium sp.]
MSFLTGAMGGTNASRPTVYTGIQIQTSAQGVPIAIVWGKNRIAPNLIWYNNFQSHKQSQKGAGGKGGSKGSGNYTYTASVILALCEGPMHGTAPNYGIEAVWADQTEYFTGGLAKLNLSVAPGTASQGVWAFLTSNYPAQALAYAYTAYLYTETYQLGSSAALPNHNFEVAGVLAYSMASSGAPNGDANPADIISDFLTNPQYSIGIASAALDAPSLAFYKTYCTAAGIFFSPVLGGNNGQEQTSSVLDRWAALSNTWIFWSGGVFKFVPLGDSAITNNGVTYTPNLTIQYDLTYDDFIATKVKQGASSGDGASKTGDGGPILVTRADPADCPNHVKVEIKDRGNAYNSAPYEWQDQGLVDQFGQIDSTVTQAHEICELSIAASVAQLIGQRAAYIRNTYSFKLGYEFSLLEPGDLVSLTDPHIGLTQFPVRIRTIDEDESGNLSIVAEEFPGGIGTAL